MLVAKSLHLADLSGHLVTVPDCLRKRSSAPREVIWGSSSSQTSFPARRPAPLQVVTPDSVRVSCWRRDRSLDWRPLHRQRDLGGDVAPLRGNQRTSRPEKGETRCLPIVGSFWTLLRLAPQHRTLSPPPPWVANGPAFDIERNPSRLRARQSERLPLETLRH